MTNDRQSRRRGDRVVARLIDGVILWLVGLVALAGVAAVGVVSPMDDETSVMRAIFLWMALGLVYEGCFTAMRSQTLGKQAVGIQVVPPAGSGTTSCVPAGRR